MPFISPDQQCQSTEEVTIFMSIITAIFPDGPGLASTRMSPFWIVLELRVRWQWWSN